MSNKKRSVKVAVAHMEVLDNIYKNVRTVLKNIKTASEQKVDILCFPESCLGDKYLDVCSEEISVIRERCANE